MADYNNTIWPAQIITYLLALFLLFTSVKSRKITNTLNTVIIALLWVWNGAVAQLMFFGDFQRQYYIWGILWLIQAILFIYFGIFKDHYEYKIKNDKYSYFGIAFIIYALVVYPFIGYLSGHGYPQTPVFGVVPCPVVVFTFGALLFVDRRIHLPVFIFPLIWAILSLYPIIMMGIFADVGVILAGIIGFVLVVIRNKKYTP